MKIGPVDHEIALLDLKKRKKLTQAKYIARSAGLPSGLKNVINRRMPLALVLMFVYVDKETIDIGRLNIETRPN